MSPVSTHKVIIKVIRSFSHTYFSRRWWRARLRLHARSSRQARRKALLIACSYETSPHECMRLKYSCKDVYTMRDVLLGRVSNSSIELRLNLKKSFSAAGWQPNEIVILVEGGAGEERNPTRNEIVR